MQRTDPPLPDHALGFPPLPDDRPRWRPFWATVVTGGLLGGLAVGLTVVSIAMSGAR